MGKVIPLAVGVAADPAAKLINAVAVEKYLASKFKGVHQLAQDAMIALAASLPPKELYRARLEIPPGAAGWA